MPVCAHRQADTAVQTEGRGQGAHTYLYRTVRCWALAITTQRSSAMCLHFTVQATYKSSESASALRIGLTCPMRPCPGIKQPDAATQVAQRSFAHDSPTPRAPSCMQHQPGVQVVLDELGAAPGCCTESAQGDLVVGRPEAVYFYSPDGRGPCFVIEGVCRRLLHPAMDADGGRSPREAGSKTAWLMAEHKASAALTAARGSAPTPSEPWS